MLNSDFFLKLSKYFTVLVNIARNKNVLYYNPLIQKSWYTDFSNKK